MRNSRLNVAGCHSAFLPEDEEITPVPFSGGVERAPDWE